MWPAHLARDSRARRPCHFAVRSIDGRTDAGYNRALSNHNLRRNPERPIQMSAPAAVSFRLAKRLDDVGFSDIVQVRNRVMELRAKGSTVYQFEGGEPYRPTPDYIKQAIVAALQENKTRYAPSSGIPELRRAIAEKLRERNDIDADEKNVLIVNGGMQ